MDSPSPLRCTLLVALALALALPASAQEPARHWEPGDAGEGPGFSYQVYSSRSEAEGFVRYEARGRVAAAPDALSRAVRTITSDPARAPKGQTRRILQSGDGEFIVHTYIDLPGFFSDRDIVTRGVSRMEGDALRIDWQATDHPAAPPSEGVVRIERSAGFWSFEPIEAGGCDVIYASYVDVAGSLPDWFVDPATEKTVAKVFEDVAAEAIQFAEASPSR